MKFIRKLHPVGQGAFFTEKIADDRGKVVFTAVYDCGSTQKKTLVGYIPQAIDCDEHIDLLCISHFDCDHINGLPTLISHATIDDKTIVMVPFAFPSALVVCDHPIAAILSLLLLHGAHLVGVNTEEEPMTIEFDALFSRSSIFSGTKVLLSRNSVCWLYVPYMHDSGYSGVLKCFESHLRGRLGKTELSHLDIRDEATRRQLKSIYKQLKPLEPTQVTVINMNSLMLLSTPGCKCPVHSSVLEASQDAAEHYRHDALCMMLPIDIAPSCFYTGDTDLHEAAVYDRLMNRVLKDSCLPKLGLLQIPHHGSANNYGTHIVQDNRYQVAFVNFHTQRKVFSPSVAADYINAYRLLILVTEQRRSLIKHQIII